MTHISASILAAILLAATLHPAAAATSRAHVPDQYDGSWDIKAVTSDGSCSAAMTYHVQIKDDVVLIAGHEIDVDGNVTSSGGVVATITKGSTKVPIIGSLDPTGTGTGTWQTIGSSAACTGTWSAKRSG
jgi:hypothetical protein